MTHDAVTLAQRLIRCASVTPKEAGVLDVLEGALAPLGFSCERMIFGDGGERVENLYARRGSTPPHFCFAGHVDVVPPGDVAAWGRDPFAGVIEDGWLKGRGAADMKGAIAAFVAAIAGLGETPGSISLLITGDEEGVAENGTRKMLERLAARGESFDACLVGEPTSALMLGDQIKIGRRGSLNARIAVIGTQGHVAYPTLADNPVPRLIRFLDAAMARELDQGSEAFPPSNLEVTDLHVGNDTENLIPARAEARLNIRFSNLHQGADLKAWLERLADAHAGAHQLAIRISGEAFLTPPGAFSELVTNAVAAQTGIRPLWSTSGGTSDARFLARYAPVVEFGLPNASMHKVDEQVRVEDVETLSHIYRRIVQGFLAGQS